MAQANQCVECRGGIEDEFAEAGSDTCGSCLIAEFRAENPKDAVPSTGDMLAGLIETAPPAVVDNDDPED